MSHLKPIVLDDKTFYKIQYYCMTDKHREREQEGSKLPMLSEDTDPLALAGHSCVPSTDLLLPLQYVMW